MMQTAARQVMRAWSLLVLFTLLSLAASHSGLTGLATDSLILAAAFWGTKFAALSIPPLILRRDKPPVFVSHGTRDRVLPIDRCSRRIVPRLEGAGYEVRYREFDGPHVVPPRIGREAAEWFARDVLE